MDHGCLQCKLQKLWVCFAFPPPLWVEDHPLRTLALPGVGDGVFENQGLRTQQTYGTYQVSPEKNKNNNVSSHTMCHHNSFFAPVWVAYGEKCSLIGHPSNIRIMSNKRKGRLVARRVVSWQPQAVEAEVWTARN